MSTTGNLPPERTVSELVQDVSHDLQAMVRTELELAKIELKNDAANAGKGAGMFAGAGMLGLYGFGLLLLGAAWGLATVLPLWASLLIVAAVLFVVAAVLALVGKRALAKVQGKPQRTITHAQQTVAVLKPGTKAPEQA
ncbi:phage holin family protein [Ornithinicoccus halotolerans]|uniref:phage holin family protein n=1 Tax=Ornithinicoccus halotolerans TaxID=1748220 RepID=UPI001296089A|nr:phage holin family protein [Ornithinicoccus halotolerans]